jgi:hypothetical protein
MNPPPSRKEEIVQRDKVSSEALTNTRSYLNGGVAGGPPPVYLEFLNTKQIAGLLERARKAPVKRRELKGLHEAFAIVFFDFYAMLIRPPKGYVDLMAELGFNDVDAIVEGLREVWCKNGKPDYVPKVLCAGKHNPYRKWVSTANSLSRFVRKLFKLREKGVDYLLNVDLTVPKETSLKLSEDPAHGVQLLRRAFKLFVSRLKRLKRLHGELGYFYNIHIWSTRTLMPHFHVHSSFCNAVLNDGKFHRFRPYFDKEELEVLRRAWADCLRAVGLDVGDCVDVKVRYCELKDEAAVVHRIKYCSRSPLIDMASFFCDKNFSKINDEETRDWLLGLVYYVNRRVCGGFLRRLKQLVGEVEGGRACPICFGESRRVEGVVNVDLLAPLFDKGDLIVVYWNPLSKRYVAMYSERSSFEVLPRLLGLSVSSR